MSGECDDCGEHAVDCVCNERDVCKCCTPHDHNLGDQVLSPVAMRDLCDRLLGLMSCLTIVVEEKGFKDWIKKPHLDLIFTIEDGIKKIEESLRYV